MCEPTHLNNEYKSYKNNIILVLFQRLFLIENFPAQQKGEEKSDHAGVNCTVKQKLVISSVASAREPVTGRRSPKNSHIHLEKNLP